MLRRLPNHTPWSVEPGHGIPLALGPPWPAAPPGSGAAQCVLIGHSRNELLRDINITPKGDGPILRRSQLHLDSVAPMIYPDRVEENFIDKDSSAVAPDPGDPTVDNPGDEYDDGP